jgi:hypothetical protein
VHVRPRDFDDARLGRLLAQRWGLEATDLRYAPVGYGSHHWIATTTGGERCFVTVDELAPPDRERRLGRLRAAMRSAVALRDEGGLEFVVAPLPATDGEIVATLDDAFAVTVLPFVDGRPWSNGAGPAAADRAVLTGMLARLHDSTATAAPYAARDDLEVEARADLEDTLDRVSERWDAGPYAAGCRDLLAAAAEDTRRRLEAYDRRAAACRARGEQAVLTHGEPKPDNLLVTAAGPALVDWDTALLAPAARDLWWLAADDSAALDRYAAATGRTVHPDDIALYRLRWDLTDVALFVRQLRGPHVRDADTAVAWRALQHVLKPVREP